MPNLAWESITDDEPEPFEVEAIDRAVLAAERMGAGTASLVNRDIEDRPVWQVCVVQAPATAQWLAFIARGNGEHLVLASTEPEEAAQEAA